MEDTESRREERERERRRDWDVPFGPKNRVAYPLSTSWVLESFKTFFIQFLWLYKGY